MSETQRQLDFDRAARWALLRHAKLPKRKGVSRGAMKLILRTIDDYDGGHGCWAAKKTLAANANLSEKTVGNAIKALKGISVLATEKQGVGSARVFYSIVWSELALLAPSYKPATKPGVATKPPAATKPRVATKPPAATKPSGEQNQCPTPSDQTVISANQTVVSPEQTVVSTAPTETVFETKINLPLHPSNHFNTERPATWTEAEGELFKAGIGITPSVVQVAKARGETPQVLIARLHEALATVALPINADKLRSPAGAITWYLKTGEWPAEAKIVSLAESAKRDKKREIEAGRLLMNSKNPADLTAQEQRQVFAAIVEYNRDQTAAGDFTETQRDEIVAFAIDKGIQPSAICDFGWGEVIQRARAPPVESA